MSRLTVVYEDSLGTVAKDAEGQLYLGQYLVQLEGDESSTRRFEKIRSYSVSYNGEPRLATYVLEDGQEVEIPEWPRIQKASFTLSKEVWDPRGSNVEDL